MSGMGLHLVDQMKARMQWLQARQKLLAENVANADTPRFKPRDLKPLAGTDTGGVALERTAPGHLGSGERTAGAATRDGKRFETTPSGNAVALEDEMIKLADTQLDYQAVAGLYTKSLSLLKIAIGKRG